MQDGAGSTLWGLDRIHESDPAEISNSFKELEGFLCSLPLEDNNAVFNLCCRLCCAYERKAFLDGLQYGAELMLELTEKWNDSTI